MNDTIAYYDRFADEYFKTTVSTKEICNRFLKYVTPGGRIVNVGAGSGRDIVYFNNAGYRAEGIDGSEALCKIAEEYSHSRVQCVQQFH